jgi:hypothetical protein
MSCCIETRQLTRDIKLTGQLLHHVVTASLYCSASVHHDAARSYPYPPKKPIGPDLQLYLGSIESVSIRKTRTKEYKVLYGMPLCWAQENSSTPIHTPSAVPGPCVPRQTLSRGLETTDSTAAMEHLMNKPSEGQCMLVQSSSARYAGRAPNSPVDLQWWCKK